MNVRIAALGLLVLTVFLLPGTLQAQSDDSRDVRRLKKQLLRMQLDSQEVKAEITKLSETMTRQRERDTQQITSLSQENQALSRKVDELNQRSDEMEAALATFQESGANARVLELEKVVMTLLFDAVAEPQDVEATILKLVNEGSEQLPKDLLLLFLAERKKRQEKYEESLGYLGALVTDFPQSPYLPRAIYDMAELLGTLGQNDQQRTLLQQLSLGNGDGKYPSLAQERLDELGAAAPAASAQPGADGQPAAGGQPASGGQPAAPAEAPASAPAAPASN